MMNRSVIRFVLLVAFAAGLASLSGCASTLKASLVESCRQRCQQVGPNINSVQDCYKQCEGK